MKCFRTAILALLMLMLLPQIALAENGNPGTAVSWTSASLDNDTLDGAWDADKYLDTWPANPVNATRDYVVTIASTGTVTISPDTKDYT